MKATVSAVLLAAGSSTRMGEDAEGNRINKMLIDICGADPILRCVRAFEREADEILIVVSPLTRERAEAAAGMTSKPVKIIEGGARRQDSVLNGVNAASCDIVAIHDCARCLVPEKVIISAMDSARRFGSGAAAIPVRDTVRERETGETVDRSRFVMMQTPQCFDRIKLLEAYSGFRGDATDDAAVWQSRYGDVRLTEGSLLNQKLTEADDVEYFKSLAGGRNEMRIGIGEDTHKLAEGRKLILGGVEIPFRLGLLGHSDADALVHAVIDALLGAAALGDIGRHFPDNDPAYKGISSLVLLSETAAMLEKAGYEVSNIDCVITAQEPKLAPYIDEMRKKMADTIARIGTECISIKATTPEHLGPEGELKSITVRAVAAVRRIG